eukprot:Rmarinus@m.25917
MPRRKRATGNEGERVERKKRLSLKEREELEKKLAELNEENNKLRKQLAEQEVAASRKSKSARVSGPVCEVAKLTPSSMGPSAMKPSKDMFRYSYCWHRGSCDNLPSGHVSMYSHSFAEFMRDMNAPPESIRKEDSRLALAFAEKMMHLYENENDRLHAFVSILEKGLGETLCSVSDPSHQNVRTDVCICSDGFPIVFFEIKKERGSHADPLLQNVVYYVRLRQRQTAENDQNVLRPALLVDLEGPRVCVWGGVFQPDDHFLVDPLFDCWALVLPHDCSAMNRLALFFRGLRRVIANLRQESSRQTKQFVPQPLSDLASNSSIEYESSLEDHPLLYVAEWKTGGESVPALVKWTRYPYSEAAHTVLANCGLAPKLYHVSKVVYGWTVVVMEFDSSRRYWGPHTKHYEVLLRDAVRALHDCGFVHGDLRPENVLVNPEASNPLWVIDFEFSGRLSETPRYPPFLSNLGKLRHAEAAPGLVITVDHDAYQLEYLLNIR